MKYILVPLDYDRCQSFLDDKVSGIGNFITRATKKLQPPNGDFYAIAKENVASEDVYKFNTAIGNVGDPWKEVLAFLMSFINSGAYRSHHLLLENWMADVKSGLLMHLQQDYSLSNNDVVFYCLSGRDSETVQRAISKVASAWDTGEWMMLVDGDLPELKPYDKIDAGLEEKIADGICMFFVGLYDGQSYLLWVKEGYDHLRADLQLFLDQSKAQLVEH